MRILIPGGSGQVGRMLARHFTGQGHDVTVLSRTEQTAPWKVLAWDGKHRGPWVDALSGCDVCINLAGKSVNCRYTDENRRAIMASRVDSTRVLGEVIAGLSQPPRVWLNASTATIYRHALERPMDEASGEFGGGEPGAPKKWDFSIEVAKAWEDAFFAANTPRTRKVALRSSIIFSPDRGGVFDVLMHLVRLGLGGSNGSGKQYVSWIHDADFIRAIEFLIEAEHVTGPVNLASPNPLPNREFMRDLRRAAGVPIGLPAFEWMLELGTWALRTESELVLKSRYVIPWRLQAEGFAFEYPEWNAAAKQLAGRWRAG